MRKAKLIAINSIVESLVITIIIKAVLIKTTFLVVKALLFLIILGKPYSAYARLII